MEKPILAVNLNGFLIKSNVWKKSHEEWFDKMAQEINIENLDKLKDKPNNYFEEVDRIMNEKYPQLNEKERTRKARELFFERVIKHIKNNPKEINEGVVNYLEVLKQIFRVCLISSMTNSSSNKILNAANLVNLFDIIETTKDDEKDDKVAVFQRFIKKHDKPLLYIGGDRKEIYNFCKKQKIKGIYANFEGKKEIKNVETVHDLKELNEIIKNL